MRGLPGDLRSGNRGRIRAKRYKIAGFFDAVRILRLDPEEGGFHDADMFFNINDRTDYDEALKRMADQAR